MSAVTLAGNSVLELEAVVPASGRWQARVGLDDVTIAEGARVTLAGYDGRLSLVGTVLRGGLDAGRWRGLVVGGAGGLDSPIPGAAYKFASAQIIASAILSAVGEVLAATPALSVVLSAWACIAGPASRALDALAAELNVPWRVRPDGTIAFEAPTWEDADDAAAVEVARDDGAGSTAYAVETIRFLPGTTIRGTRAATVIHVVDDGGIRTSVLSGTERLNAALRRLVAKHLPPLDYLALYPARVVAQNGDGSLELRPVDGRIPPSSRVPLRLPLPGMTAQVAPGASVLLGWEGGDPSAPFAALFAGGSLLALTVTAPSLAMGDSGAVPLVVGPALVALLNAIQAQAATATVPNSAEAALVGIATAIATAVGNLQTTRLRGS